MMPRFLDAGETALVVEFAGRIDPAARDAVLALDARLQAEPPPGLIETVPTYRSLMAHYDPLRIARESLIERIQRVLNTPAKAAEKGVLWRIPACYDPELAEDLPELAMRLGKSESAIAALHASAEYRIAMIGFAPGWAYLDGLPEALAVPRRASPRGRIPENSLIIAGGLAIISSMPMPSGGISSEGRRKTCSGPTASRRFFVLPVSVFAFRPSAGVSMRPCWRARLRAKSLRNGPPHERSAHRFRCCRDNAAGSRPVRLPAIWRHARRADGCDQPCNGTASCWRACG